MKVTPWDVSGEIDYNKLVKDFGATLIDEKIKKRLKTPLLKRGNYFSHRDFDKWLEAYDKKKIISVVTGRGPSEKMHLGHLVPFLAAKSLQEKYNCKVYIPISEDEKYFIKPNLTIEEVEKFADDNIIDILALGFKPGKTFIVKDFSYSPLYKYSAKLAKLITYSEVKSIF